MKNFTYRLSCTTSFLPVTITAKTEVDAIEELMNFYENGVLEIKDESFDLDLISTTESYTPMTPPAPVTNGYVPLSSIASSYDEDEDDDETDFDSDIQYQSYVPLSSFLKSEETDPILELNKKLLEIIEQLGNKLESMDEKISQLEQSNSQLPNGYRPLNNTRR